MTITNDNPNLDPSNPEGASANIDAALREADKTTPDGDVSNVPPEKLTDDQQFNALENLSDAELEKMLDGGDDAAAPAAQDPAPGVAEPAAAPAAPAPDPAARQPEFIPYARFAEVNTKARDLEAENTRLREDRAYLAGRDAARTAAPKADDVDEEAVIIGNLERLQANYKAAALKLADEFDNGGITMREYREREQKLNEVSDALADKFATRLNVVRDQKNTPDPQLVRNTINTDPVLVLRTNELKAQNPWLDKASVPLLETLKERATANLAAKGVNLGPDTSSTWLLRQEMAAVGNAMGLQALGAPSAPAAPAAPGTTPQNPNTPTVDQGKAKLALAGQQPPLPTTAGVNAPTDALKTVKAEEMTEDQLASLSVTELDAILNNLKRKVA